MELIAIIEKDNNSDVLMSWSYPYIEPGIDSLLIAKSRIEENRSTGSHFSKYKDNWCYVYTLTNISSQRLPRVNSFSIVVESKAYNPERFQRITELLCQKYLLTGEPPQVLAAYLSIYTKDSYDFGTLGNYSASDFDDRKALAKCSLKDVVSTFGRESILIYTAILLKKRVIVYSSRLEQLQEVVRSLPLFIWHRKNWSILRPYVSLSDKEIEELSSLGTYVAGFTDQNVQGREDLYDLYVNVDDKSVSVVPQAKNDFLLGKPHKEIAELMVASSEDANVSEQQFIKEIAFKTKQLLDVVISMIPEGENQLTVETIKAQEMPSNMARFLWNLAIAEGYADI